MTDLDQETDVEVISGVSMFTGEGFCQIAINGKPVGQMSPAEVRNMVMGWLQAAEAAENDAAMMKVLIEDVGLTAEQAAPVLVGIRQKRAEMSR